MHFNMPTIWWKGIRKELAHKHMLDVKNIQQDTASTRHFSDGFHDFSVTIPRCYKDVYVNSFFPCTAKLWNSLPIECFPLTYDLSGFKSRINKYFLTVGFLNISSMPQSFCASFSCNSMCGSGCLALHGVNPNLRKY